MLRPRWKGRSPWNPATPWPAPWLRGLLLAALVLLAVVARVPLLYNARATLNSDEAVNALVIKHLIERGEVALYNWDASYYGIVEGLIALPFVFLLGFEALAFKLAAVATHVALMLLTYSLGVRLYGAREGILAAALLAIFSPQVLIWSTLASGGYMLVVAWGTLALLSLRATRSRPSPLRTASFGLVVGFGLYIYELFLVYVATLAIAGFFGSAWLSKLRGAPGSGWQKRLGSFGASLKSSGFFLLGFTIGWSPKLASLLTGSTGLKEPTYLVASGPRIWSNIGLLVHRCIPALFGIRTGSAQTDSLLNPREGTMTSALGVLLLSLAAIAWLAALARRRQAIRRILTLRPVTVDVETLLVLLVAVTCVAFVLSGNPVDATSSRYLLPWLTALPLLTGAAVIRWTGSHRGLRIAAVGFLVLAPMIQAAEGLQIRQVVDSRLALRRLPDGAALVIGWLENHGIRGGYASYWISYRTTFLSGERIILTPYQDWDRYLPYTRYVRGLGNPAYVFSIGGPRERLLVSRLASCGRSYARKVEGPYAIYTSADGRRLLPPDLARPEVLRDPRAHLVALAAPTSVRGGESFLVPIEVTNLGDAAWSAVGVKLGRLRVAACYRWLDAEGRAIVRQGSRSPLPHDLASGATLRMNVQVLAPSAPGSRILIVTLVQDGVAWFDQATDSALRLDLQVTGSPAPGRVEAAAPLSSGSPGTASAESPPG